MRKTRKRSVRPNPMYVCVADAVAGDAKDFRPGAHHAMLIILDAASLAAAREDAAGFVNGEGWLHIEVRHVEVLAADSSLIDDDETLREAAEIARLRGHCIAVDLQEIPLDS